MPSQPILWTIVAASLIVFWLAFAVIGKPKIDTTGAIAVMQYGRAMSLFALIFALAPPTLLGSLAWRIPWRDPQTLTIVGTSFLAMSVLAGLLLVEVVRVRVVLTPDGVTRHSPWTGKANIQWNEVRRVSWSSINRWHVLHADSATIRISHYLTGQDELKKLLGDKIQRA